jgi:hypothetical protein
VAELSFVSHLPLLRMTPQSLDCGGFQLWRMPFEVFDDLSQGAFTDHRAAYEATAPVFLRLDMNVPAGDGLVRQIDSPSRKALELKIPTARWHSMNSLGLEAVVALHSSVVDRFSAALALAAPASLLPPSRWSVTFGQVDEQHAFVLGSEVAGTIRVQGDADLEYLFSPACVGGELDGDVLQQAVEWQGMIDFIGRHEDVAAALQVLRAAAAPTLTEAEQSLLCTVALEALLLPEVRSGLEDVFATRSSHLPSVQDAAAVRDAAVTLYDSRSAGVHGGAQAPDAMSAIGAAHAAQLLAASVVGFAYGLHEGRSLEDLRTGLDGGPLPAFNTPTWTLHDDPPGRRAASRISPSVPRQPFIQRFTSDGLQGVDGAYACYSPLTGLGCTAMQPLSDPPCPGIIPLTGSEVVSLEDKDIARDYLGELHQIPERIAALTMFMPDAGVDEQLALRRLRRSRELAVASLRLAGFDQFVDPDLAGLHVMHERRPLREPSVLRQTVLTRLRRDPDYVIEAGDRDRTSPMWDLISRYAQSPGHPDIERWLSAFRRVHDSDFLPALARANLAIALVEGLLGRFRPPDDPVPLEALVAKVASMAGDSSTASASAWFSAEARAWRNALAHGRLQEIDDAAIGSLMAIARAALPQAISHWLDGGDPKRRPAKMLMRELSSASAT